MGDMTASAVLMMLPRRARTPVAVLAEGPVPSSLRLDVFGGRDLFVRMRRGTGVHGLSEPYREQPRDEYPAESDPAVVVTSDSHAPARFACSASVFGATDVIVFVPLDADGEAPAHVRIPIPSLDRPSWHDYELVSRTRMECRYRVADTNDAIPVGGSRAVSAL
ncbi:hypothetical protein [Leifsonia shinshuensis]|uniref:hypothetical protein n=1 Tax=Leifsonia TaxID=110932 RepID=UPI00285EB479|nr:hypothetical protein [Leifsonia shinshuensis]MDR6972184.1 hypothetical protein [Leifsonia shinshuensis]